MSGYDGCMENVLRSTRLTLEMIKWEHSIFALPFALTGAVLAAAGWPRLAVLGWIVVCMVSARSAAMAFNRLVDARLDKANPRTANRAIPAGLLSPGFVAAFTVVACVIFVGSCAMLNRLTLELAPVALVVVLSYSYMKRITRWSHLVLRTGAGDCADGGVDRGAGDIGVEAAAADGDRDSLGGWVRHSVCVPGLCAMTGAWACSVCRRRSGWKGRSGLRGGMHLAMVLLLFVMVHVFGLGVIALVGMCVVALPAGV